MAPVPLLLHPDRAFPADPATRALARRIHTATRDLPLLCLHGHVDAGTLARDDAFDDPAALLVVPDHYVTRMLLSRGVPPAEVGRRDDGRVRADSRTVWRRLCENWYLFRGTPSRFWLEYELAEVFGVDVQPSPETADAIYDRIATRIAEPDFRPLALLDRFGIELLATTDPVTSDLADHAELARRDRPGRVIPTFRPDALVHLNRPGWRDDVHRLGELSDSDTDDFEGFLAALRQRREVFLAAGARASDHGHLNADTAPLSAEQAARLYAEALRGPLGEPEAEAFAGHMLFEFAAMSVDDGLVMQLHPGVLRDHDRGWAARFGPDTGFDIPVRTDFTRGLRPLLEEFGHHPGFRLIVFTVDETAYSRELAPLAGAYPAVLLGAPWWFLDSPEGMRRFREAAVETAGFYNTSGFVDDTRAFLSIPARHDLSRRIDAGFLARLVAEHRLSEDEAIQTAVDLAYDIPRQAYSVPGASGPANPAATGTDEGVSRRS